MATVMAMPNAPAAAPAQQENNVVVKYPKTVIENGKRYNTQFRILHERKESQSADPIEDKADIDRIVLDFLMRQKWREAMLFVLGCNTAFRIGDLLCYRVSDVIGVNGEIKLSFATDEQKTGHGRKVFYNTAIKEMMDLYLEKDSSLVASSFLFYNKSRGARLCRMDDGSEVLEAMSRQTAWKLIKSAVESLGIEGQYSAHTLRQTFSYQFEKMMFNDKEKIGIPLTVQALQMMLGHSATSSTMHYS